MNPYRSGEQKLIPAVLIYAVHEDQVLMIHRSSDPSDYHQGKWNGLGGKLEPGESFAEAARREFLEESGAHLTRALFEWRGQILFPDFQAHRQEDWLVHLFVVPCDPQLVQQECSEGRLVWIAIEEVLNRSLWVGDREFLPQILAGRRVNGTIWYSGEQVLRHELTVF